MIRTTWPDDEGKIKKGNFCFFIGFRFVQYLAFLEPVVAGNGVAGADARKLLLVKVITSQQRSLFVLGQHLFEKKNKASKLLLLFLLPPPHFPFVCTWCKNVSTLCSGTSKCCVMLTRSSDSRNCSMV